MREWHKTNILEVSIQHRTGTSCVEAFEAEPFILTDGLNGALFFFLVTVMTRKRSNTAMAIVTKIALSRAAQVDRECAGKIA